MADVRLLNVLLLGAAFHLLFFSFQTSVFIQQTVVNSLRRQPEHKFTGDGYVSLCLTYAVFAASNWLAPSLIAITGLKLGMFAGALTYVAYSASFIQPTTSLFYLAAALIGLGAGLLWTAQGSFLSLQSDTHTASRNAAIFWSLLQSSILFGNLFVYFAFDNLTTTISEYTRHLVYGVLTLVGSLGALMLLLLRNNSRTLDENGRDVNQVTAWSQFVSALELARTWDMALLSTAFLFTGQLLSFFTGVYGTAIGATSQFGAEAKRYMGLAGIFIGLGEILGGGLFGLLAARLTKRPGRDSIFLLGFLVTLAGLALTFAGLPADSPLVSPASQTPLVEPRLWLVLLASLLIGLGDACFNTQVYSLLMSVYQRNSAGAFALFKFVQSAGSALAFLYSTRLDLYYQLLILATTSSLATVCFCLVEWRSRRAAASLVAGSVVSAISPRGRIEKTESQQNIIANDAADVADGGQTSDSDLSASSSGSNLVTRTPTQWVTNMIGARPSGAKSGEAAARHHLA